MGEMSKRMMVFTGTANPELADGIAAHLGIELGKVKIRRFANGEIYVRYLESVRGADVFLDDCRVPGDCLLGGKEKLDERLARVREGRKSKGQAAMMTFPDARFDHVVRLAQAAISGSWVTITTVIPLLCRD